MSLIKSLEWRYATKAMNGNKIPQDKMDNILRAIQLAPSSFGLTPYSVIVVESDELKEKLVPAAYGQPQIMKSSAVIVFAIKNTIDSTTVSDYMNEIAEQRNVPTESLEQFSNYVNGTIQNLTDEQKQIWASKQTYIALGFGLVAAANEEVDATPMEGFIPSQVDEVLGLKEMGLSSSVILTLGYRDEVNDYLVSAPKVRKPKEKLFIKK